MGGIVTFTAGTVFTIEGLKKMKNFNSQRCVYLGKDLPDGIQSGSSGYKAIVETMTGTYSISPENMRKSKGHDGRYAESDAKPEWYTERYANRDQTPIHETFDKVSYDPETIKKH